jgi:hypothetical protein
MNEGDCWPLDAVSATALVARVVRDIDESSEDDSLTLLSNLLCAAWRTRLAQDQ